MKCRHCGAELNHLFLDLGAAPPSNSYLSAEQLCGPEVAFPLRIQVCDECWLVQTEDYTDASDLFNSEYAYFSSASSSWLEHAAKYASQIVEKQSLDATSFVIEVASNDGYLLKNFVEKGIPCLGVEPTDSTADAAEALNIPVLREFFGVEVARSIVGNQGKANLICGNNVYAHVPDINDFTSGLATVLAEDGIINLEFPHLLKLMKYAQFDTVYHEHFSYLSLNAVTKVFAAAGLRIFDVEELSTHGGSLRLYGCLADAKYVQSAAVERVLKEEEAFGLTSIATYEAFQEKANTVKNDFVSFLIDCKRKGKKVSGYGAAAKGNTLMNYGGVRTDLIDSVFDRAPSKQGKYLPGSRLPVLTPEKIDEIRPDYLVIFPWNIAQEVIAQEGERVREWGCQFVTAVPELKVTPA